MKSRILFWFCVFALSKSLLSQQLFYDGTIYYYAYDSDTSEILAYKLDSVFNVEDTMMFQFESKLNYFPDNWECNCSTLHPYQFSLNLSEPFGAGCIQTMDGIITFANHLDSALTFDFNIPVSDSTIFYSDSIQKFEIVRREDSLLLFLGQFDVYRNFEIIHTNLDNVEIMSPINHSIIQIGEETGIKSFFDVFNFPEEIRMFTTKGRNNQIGFKPVSMAEIHNWQIGDEFQHRNLTSGMFPYTRYTKHTILEKQVDSFGNISYLADQVVYQWNLTSLPQYPYWNSYWTTTNQIVNLEYSSTEYPVIAPHDGTITGRYFYDDFNGSIRLNILRLRDQPTEVCIESNCWGNSDSYSPGHYLYFIKDIGLYRAVYPALSYGLSTDLIYFHSANGESFGTQFIMGMDDLETKRLVIFPNPTYDILNISFSNPSNSGELKVLDMSGRIVSIELIANGVSSTKLDFGTFPEGMYFIQYRDSNGMTFFNKVIKNN